MNIAVMGYGTVGSGVVEIINTKHDIIKGRNSSEDLNVKYILDLRKFPGDPNEDKVTDDFNKILEDDSVEIVVEAMGGVNPAFDFTAKCLAAGKHVCTSNKELVSTKGNELMAIAREHNVNYLFEASVGGGIPVLRPLSVDLAGNNIQRVNGILNGTTNFILTKMIFENLTFEDALKIAQDNGYAEKDPTADVEGIDAVRKISILNNLSFGFGVDPDQIHTEGITKITLEDVAYAENYDCVIKLLGTAEKLPDGQVYILVSPAFVPKTSMLAKVDDVLNAVLVQGDNVGDVMFYGPGAGKLPTASAVVGDVVDCANHKDERRSLAWGEWDMSRVADYREIPNQYYLRLKVTDPEAAQHEIRDAFGNIYLLARSGAYNLELALITDALTENQVREKLAAVHSAELKSLIRVANC
ncbi:MAG: homoserine dehydrogenase [Clostridia bacterium]|nr:homoserine dehydrogenase [Clostridia bacterium]